MSTLRSFQRFSAVVFLLLVIWRSGSKADAGGNIVFTSVPTWGQLGRVQGQVSNVNSASAQLILYTFVPDFGGWFSTCGTVPIQANGSFDVDLSDSISKTYATRFSAYVVPQSIAATLSCYQGTEAVPYVVERNAIARGTIPRAPLFKQISFSGLTWYVRDTPLKAYPNLQFFLGDNAFVDSSGRLHLKLSKCGDSWCAAEVFTTERVGYGNYTFDIETPVNSLDPNVTLGLFTWDELASDQNHREWDLEVARWGQYSNNPGNAQYVVQPYNATNHLVRFNISPAGPTTHTVNWSAAQVNFASNSGSSQALGQSIQQWSFVGGATPGPSVGDARLHMNLYIGSGNAPTVPVNTEIIIKRVQYTPSPVQIGFTENAQSLQASSTTHSVLISGDASCSATVEPDSPWLTVSGSSVVSSGTVLQYNATGNATVPRSGKLILHSDTCNLSPGQQTLTVNQAGQGLVPQWSITNSQDFPFKQGQANARYTITVGNNGQPVPSNAGVRVEETAPAGLILQYMWGSGWYCTGSVCTRNDGLAPGATYPPIAVVFNVSASAPTPLINTATVSGGGAASASASATTTVSSANPPFGVIDTPAPVSTGVSGAVSMTGWALSGVGVQTVGLWRERVGSEPVSANGLVFLVNATMLRGARPDVALNNPNYPGNDSGWGAQILTNMLPNTNGLSGSGNGTYRVHALVTDNAGAVVDLGVRTITTDNAHALLPFGTIDTPAQGGTVSGSAYVNFGWAVSPNPGNVIPKDGSTISVYIDGNLVGHPVYNNYRSDIATLFPGLQNSNGAVGYFMIDSTKLANGLHTISWTVQDNAGNAQGLGSRFFNVQN